MAIVINPALSMDASGNMGGICYAKWRGLHVARGAWTGTQTSTSAQLACRADLETVSKAWSGTLNEAQRERWRKFARVHPVVGRLGREYRPTGYQAFMSFNLQKVNCGGSLYTSPPVTAEPYALSSITFVVSVGGGYVTVRLNRPSWSPAPYYYQFWRSGAFDNPGRRAQVNDYRVIAVQHSPNYFDDLTCVYGKYYWYRGRGVTLDGHAGQYFTGQIHYV